MATEFKRRVYANVPASVITHADAKIYTAPANCDTVVIGLLLTNTSGASITADVGIVPQDNTEGPIGASTQENFTYLIKGAQVPVGSALEIISGKVVLANTGAGTGDTLCVRASLASSLDATVSVLENT
jgi:hypothetical protein